MLLPGFDDEEVDGWDGLFDMLCCDKFDSCGLVTFILTLLFVCSYHTHTVVLIVHVSCANKEYILLQNEYFLLSRCFIIRRIHDWMKTSACRFQV